MTSTIEDSIQAILTRQRAIEDEMKQLDEYSLCPPRLEHIDLPPIFYTRLAQARMSYARDRLDALKKELDGNTKELNYNLEKLKAEKTQLKVEFGVQFAQLMLENK